jgi:hypothetical protein
VHATIACCATASGETPMIAEFHTHLQTDKEKVFAGNAKRLLGL